MPTADNTHPVWRKSSHSSNGANCVEVAFTPDTVATRDSKNPTGPILRFTQPAWVGFVVQAETGELTQH